jgi:hypothetical protein
LRACEHSHRSKTETSLAVKNFCTLKRIAGFTKSIPGCKFLSLQCNAKAENALCEIAGIIAFQSCATWSLCDNAFSSPTLLRQPVPGLQYPDETGRGNYCPQLKGTLSLHS